MILKPTLRFAMIYGLIISAALCQEPKQVPQGKRTSEATEATGSLLNFHNVAEGLGIIFGLIGLIAFLDQRRSAREQADVLSYVKRNMTKEVTEETIAELSAQLKLMQKQTKEELPKLARIAVLNEQGERIKTAICEMYLQWKAIQLQIGSTGKISLDAEIESAIADRMLPGYMRRQKAEGGRERLAILGAGTAVAGILLPFPVSRVVEAVLGVALVLTILQLVSSSAAITSRQQRNIHTLFRLVLTIAVISAGGFAYFFLTDGDVTSFGRILGFVLAGIAVLLVAGAYFIDDWVWRWLQRKQISGL